MQGKEWRHCFKDRELISKVKVENPDILTFVSRLSITLPKLWPLFIMSLSVSILKVAVTASLDSLPSPSAPYEPP